MLEGESVKVLSLTIWWYNYGSTV